ncbi:MAG: hypothetical protein GTN49_07270 [candidate division Zixibacteria bacterium]|nr:hypothetical protein [candidate division Zixibacteria bacterium]
MAVPDSLVPETAGVQLPHLSRASGNAALPAVALGLIAAQSLVYNLLAFAAASRVLVNLDRF